MGKVKFTLPELYGMRIIPNKKCKRNIMEYRRDTPLGDYCNVHPDLYGCLKIVDPDKWVAFFKLAGIMFKKIKFRSK